MLDLPRILSRLSGPAASLPASSREVRAALTQAIDLRSLARERREMVLRNSPKLHTLALAEQLLALAADVAGDSPAEAMELLDAFEILADLPAFDVDELHQAGIAELSALALIRRAVLLIKLQRYPDAALILRIGSELEFFSVENAGEYHEARARLAAIHQQLGPALEALAAARELYESIADPHLVGRVLVAEGFAYGEARQFGPSVDALVGALELIDPTRDRRLALAACINLARALRDAGRAVEALETIALTRSFVAAHARRLDRLHLQWLEAGLLSDRREFHYAAKVYLEVAEAFGNEGLAIEVGEIAIEAAEAFARAGRGRDLLPLLALAERIFRAQGWEDERLAAWLALRAQLAGDVVTAAALAAARRAARAR